MIDFYQEQLLAEEVRRKKKQYECNHDDLVYFLVKCKKCGLMKPGECKRCELSEKVQCLCKERIA